MNLKYTNFKVLSLNPKFCTFSLYFLPCIWKLREKQHKQVSSNICLADTLTPSSFIYLIYMGGTGPCDSIKIIFGYHVNN